MESTGAVSTVIVAYNSGDLLRRCLATVGSGHGEVVVVDNASPDGGARLACREFPHVRLIERPRNDGFGTAANAGIAATEGRWILVLNPDAWPWTMRSRNWPSSRTAAPGWARPGRCCSTRRETSALDDQASAQPRGAGAPGPPFRAPSATPTASCARESRRSAPSAGGIASSCRAPRCSSARSVRPGWRIRRELLHVRRGRGPLRPASRRRLGRRALPVARFVHVGAGSTHAVAERMYLELLRSWLRLIAKRKGPARRSAPGAGCCAHSGASAVRARAAAPDAAAWLASEHVGELLSPPK